MEKNKVPHLYCSLASCPKDREHCFAGSSSASSNPAWWVPDIGGGVWSSCLACSEHCSSSTLFPALGLVSTLHYNVWVCSWTWRLQGRPQEPWAEPHLEVQRHPWRLCSQFIVLYVIFVVVILWCRQRSTGFCAGQCVLPLSWPHPQPSPCLWNPFFLSLERRRRGCGT